MGTIFTEQTYLKIRLTAGVDITSCIEKEIHYVKPDGTTGQLTAMEENPTTGIIYYDVPAGSTLIDQAGTWKFWAYIKFADGRIARGETWKEKIVLNTL